MLPEGHQSAEKRSCKRRDNDEQANYQNFSLWLAAFFFDSVVGVGRAAHCRSSWGALSSVSSFYGNNRNKFRREPAAARCRAIQAIAALNARWRARSRGRCRQAA